MDYNKEKTILVSSAWWLHVGANINGNVLAIGGFSEDTIVYIRSVSNSLEMRTGKAVCDESNLGCRRGKYDSILINNVDTSISDEYIVSLSRNLLSDTGSICIYEMNRAQLSNIFTYPLDVLKRIIGFKRETSFIDLSKGLKLEVFPTIAYEQAAYESIHNGLYNSNKNIFLFKEKSKKILYRTRLVASLVSANIILINKSSVNRSLISSVLDAVSSCIEENVSKTLECSNILYNVGKLIITLTNRNENLGNYIAIFAFSKNAIKQRNNERVAIKRLSKNKMFSKLVSEDIYLKDISGLPCFIMQRRQGTTVDIYTDRLGKMTQASFEILVKLTHEFSVQEHNDSLLKSKIKNYCSEMKNRLPGYEHSIETLESLVLTNYPEKIILPCILHGDLKLENFMLDRELSISGIIDWELYEAESFPMLDLFYLVSYNIQVREGCDFLDAFLSILEMDLQDYEISMFRCYRDEFEINEELMEYLIIVFFIHHFSCRVYIDHSNEQFINKLDFVFRKIIEV